MVIVNIVVITFLSTAVIGKLIGGVVVSILHIIELIGIGGASLADTIIIKFCWWSCCARMIVLDRLLGTLVGAWLGAIAILSATLDKLGGTRLKCCDGDVPR